MQKISSILNCCDNQKSLAAKFTQTGPSSFFQPVIQPKLTISEPGDIYEQEADAMADKVMRMYDTSAGEQLFFKPADFTIQQKCAHCNEEEKLQLQRKEANDLESAGGIELDNYIGGLSGKGQSLLKEAQHFFEPRFGYNFSNVKIHTDTTAAESAQSMNALAYTSGSNIVFNNGQYNPHTGSGRRLLGHELTHVVQQSDYNVIRRTPLIEGDTIHDPLMDEFSRDTGITRDSVSIHDPLYEAWLLRNSFPATHGADQRRMTGATAAVPDANLATEFGYELDPGSRPAPVRPSPTSLPGAPPPPPPARIPWDGSSGGGASAARTAMQAELFAAYDAYITYFRPATTVGLVRPRVPYTATAAATIGAAAPTGVLDIANQARGVLEARYAVSMDQSATSAGQLRARAPLQAPVLGSASTIPNVFDASSEADRSALTNSPDLAPGVSWWLFENDSPGAAGAAGTRRFATEILAAHHYSSQDDTNGSFRWQVANAYAAASTLAPNNRRQLIDYRITGWNEADPTGSGKGFTLLSSFDPGTNASRAELVHRWQIFKTATHESLHLRTHPAFESAEQGRGTMKEGFTEMFAISTLNTDVFPRIRSGSLEGLRQTVEGSLSPAVPDQTIVVDSVTPVQYAAHRAQAERIRDGGTPAGGVSHPGIGEAGVRAAFFQGHVEYLGLSPAGSQLATLTTAGASPLINIPGAITGLDDLARRTGVQRLTIENDNPGITDALPTTAILAGCREHLAVGGESRANIAAQNGVSEADLVQANPGISRDLLNRWSVTAGQRILIPVH